jgi:hypothetical protein
VEQAGNVSGADWVSARMALVKDLTRLRDQFGLESQLPWMTSPSPAITRRSLETSSPLVNH